MSEKKEQPRMDPSVARSFYLQPWVIDALFQVAKGREMAPVYFSTQYGKRPDAVQFPGDVERMAKDGVTSFHCSVERWSNPLHIFPGLKKHELDELRTGFDLLFDVDSHKDVKAAQITSHWLIKAIRAYGVQNISVKFSGRRGFHIGIPFESLPKKVFWSGDKGEVFIKDLYPDILQVVARFLRAKIQKKLAESLLALNPSWRDEMHGNDGSLDPFKLVDVEQNWSVRHLFRMPYSFNEKTGLVSVPIDPERLLDFSPEEAKPENVKEGRRFFANAEENEAELLVIEALEWRSHQTYAAEIEEKLKKEKKKRDFSEPTEAIPENMFPPCIHLILAGMKDGRKRALFVLINFLQTVGWSYDQIEERINQWNAKNPEPLPQTIVNTQLAYARKRKAPILPPNCDNPGYYTDLGVKCADNICHQCKNPAAFAKRRQWAYDRMEKEKEGKQRKKKGKKAKVSEGSEQQDQGISEEQSKQDA